MRARSSKSVALPRCSALGVSSYGTICLMSGHDPSLFPSRSLSESGPGEATKPVPVEQWKVVDAGWGRKAVEFATLSEPANCREYVAMHHRLGVSNNDRLLDVACGSGLAIELAALRGASCAGIDASERLVAIARDRNPDAQIV